MIDPQLLRESPEIVKASQRLRGESVDLVDEAIAADAARRSAIAAFEADRAEQCVSRKSANRQHPTRARRS